MSQHTSQGLERPAPGSRVFNDWPKGTGYKKYYKRHFGTHRKLQNDINALIVPDLIHCIKCDSYVLLCELINHCKSCPYMKRPSLEYKYVCMACDYHSNFQSIIQSHLRIHTGERPYKCDHCHYKSKNHSDLRKHVRIRHSNS